MMAKLMAKKIAVLSSSNSMTTKKIEQLTTMFRPFYGRSLLFCILKVPRLLDCHLPIGWTNQWEKDIRTSVGYALVIKHGLLENPPFISLCPMESSSSGTS